MEQDNEKYDFTTKESQYLLKKFSETSYEILEKLEEKDKTIADQEISIKNLTEDNSNLIIQVEKLEKTLNEFVKISVMEMILRKLYRISRKLVQKIYDLFKKIFRIGRLRAKHDSSLNNLDPKDKFIEEQQVTIRALSEDNSNLKLQVQQLNKILDEVTKVNSIEEDVKKII